MVNLDSDTVSTDDRSLDETPRTDARSKVRWLQQHPIRTLLALALLLIALPLSLSLVANLTPYYREQVATGGTSGSQEIKVKVLHQRILHVGEASLLTIQLVTNASNENAQGRSASMGTHPNWSLPSDRCIVFTDASTIEVTKVKPSGGAPSTEAATSCQWLVAPLKSGTQAIAWSAIASNGATGATKLYQSSESLSVWASPFTADQLSSGLGVISAALALVAAFRKRDGDPTKDVTS
jgi:hypothetical protein